ncbi:MAG: 5'-nucleotidase C-terminal domain-containing protein [Myxococcota bacterium]
MRRGFAFLIAWALAIPLASAQDADLVAVARIMATSGIGGNLGMPVCDDEVDVAATGYANVTPRLRTMAQRSDRPLILDTGGLLSPGGFGQYAAQTSPSELAALIEHIGYRALAMAPADLSADREPLLAVLRTLREHRIPAIASNLYCAPGTPLCEVLVDGSDGIPLLTVGNRQVAVVSVMPPSSLAQVAPDRAVGLRIQPVEDALPRLVARARQQGATMVVASVAGVNAGDALELANNLPDDGRPDMLFVADGGTSILFARPRAFRPAVVAAAPGGAVRLWVRDNPITGSYDILANAVVPSRTMDSRFRRWLADTGEAYCEAWGRELPGGRTEGSVTGEDMLNLAAGAMREAADAEVAVINRGVLDSHWTQAHESGLTASDVFIALQYDEPISVATVSGAWLQTLEANRGNLITLGLDGSINGRTIQPQGSYRVATLRFLARGGDGALPEGAEWEAIGDATLRATVLEHLEVPRDTDPREAFEDLDDQLEWVFQGNIDADFSGSAVENPLNDAGETVYDASQLARSDTITFGFDATLRADARSRSWAWENVGDARQRLTQTGTDDFAEATDLLSFRTTALYRGFRAASPRFFIPEPYAEAYLESELTVADESEFRHLLLRPSAGLRFQLTNDLTFQLGGGFQGELLDPDLTLEPGAIAQLRLLPWTLLQDGTRKLTVEFSLDYFLSGNNQELRGTFDSTFDLAGPLGLTWGIKLFGQYDGENPVGVAIDVTAGLRVRWLLRALP